MGASWPDDDDFDAERAEMEAHYDGGDPFVETDHDAPLPASAPKASDTAQEKPKRDESKARANVDDSHNEKKAVESGGAVAASRKTNAEKPKGKGRGVAEQEEKPAQRKKAELQRGDHYELAQMMIQDLTQEWSGGPLVFDDADLRQYKPERGVFEIITEKRQLSCLAKYAGKFTERDGKSLMMQKNTVQGTQWYIAKSVMEEGFFKAAPKGIAFSNGFVRVQDDGLFWAAHSPENRARHGYDFAYDPDAKAPRFQQFLDEVFQDDFDKDKKIALVQEFGGAVICALATRFAVMLITVGEGANGKSTFGDILAGIMPEGSVCSVGPHDWKQDYALAMMRGKLFNQLDELPADDLKDSDRIKAIVTGGPVKARVIYKEPVNIRCIAGHYFSTNALPGVSDQSKGFWRRVLPLAFNRHFDGSSAEKDLARKILATEKAGIIAWFIEGAARLLRNNDYTIPASVAKLKARWRNEAETVAAFVHENYCITEKPSEGAQARPLYQQYRTHTRENGGIPVGFREWRTRMQALGVETRRYQGHSVYLVRAYRGNEGPPDDDEFKGSSEDDPFGMNPERNFIM